MKGETDNEQEKSLKATAKLYKWTCVLVFHLETTYKRAIN